MLRVHTADFSGTQLESGKKLEGKLLTFTSTKEKIAVGVIVSVETRQSSSDEMEIAVFFTPFFPDVETQVGWIASNISLVTQAESMQTRENRAASVEKRKAVRFPPAMGLRTIPVFPTKSEPMDNSAPVEDAGGKLQQADTEQR